MVYYHNDRQVKKPSRGKPAPLSRAFRAELRHKQILQAAKHCFARVGFHSTSMAEIAYGARMSVGQIYRHFPSKESLIEGIIQEDIDHQTALLHNALNTHASDVIKSVSRRMDHDTLATRRDYIALMLEIAAEAARNPKIRALLVEYQLKGHAALVKSIEKLQPGVWPRGELNLRLRLVYAVTQGIATHEIIDAHKPSDKMLKRRDELIKRLLTPGEL
jgi:AcrR family transcriptional regulator